MKLPWPIDVSKIWYANAPSETRINSIGPLCATASADDDYGLKAWLDVPIPDAIIASCAPELLQTVEDLIAWAESLGIDDCDDIRLARATLARARDENGEISKDF